MTADQVQTWLASRRPAPPDVLAQRLSALLAAQPAGRLAPCRTMADALGQLGVATLASLEGREPTSRDVAMDLLAADAFVTYAFEAAAESADDPMDQVAADVLDRVSP